MTNHFSKLNLKKLRNGRNNTAHLYDEADDEGVIGYKTQKAIMMMRSMDSVTGAKFTANFGPSFIRAVVKHFENISLPHTTDPEEIKLAEEWWTL